MPISTTPMAAKNIAPNTAFLNAILRPALKASRPPVTPPAIIWFMMSYLFRIDINTQLEMENNPAHNPKLPELLENVYLPKSELFSSAALHHRRISHFLETATCLESCTECIQQHIPSQILLPYHQQFCRDRVAIASSWLINLMKNLNYKNKKSINKKTYHKLKG